MKIAIKHGDVVPGQASVYVELTGDGVNERQEVMLSSGLPWQSSLREWAAHKCRTDRDNLEIDFQPLQA